MEHKFGNIWTLFNIIINVSIILAIFLLSFIEWNLKKIFEDVRSIVINEYLTIFTMILLTITDYVNINDYAVIFVLHVAITIITCISNYYFIYIIRLLYIRNNEKDVFLRNSVNRSGKISLNGRNNSGSLVLKVLKYHYVEYSDEEQYAINNRSTSSNNNISPTSNNLSNSSHTNYTSPTNNNFNNSSHTNYNSPTSYNFINSSHTNFTTPSNHNTTKNNLL